MRARSPRNTPIVQRTSFRLVAALSLSLLLPLGGCGRPGVNWRGFKYEFVLPLSKNENRLTFVYLRSPYLVECTRFEENVLKNPAVLAALQDVNPVAIDFGWDSHLADRWQLERAPAFAIVDPDGALLASGHGEVAVDELVKAINKAKARFAERASSGN